MEVPNAHEGGKVHCATVGPDGNLYTGGDDKVRGWCQGVLVWLLVSLLWCVSWQLLYIGCLPVPIVWHTLQLLDRGNAMQRGLLGYFATNGLHTVPVGRKHVFRSTSQPAGLVEVIRGRASDIC